MALTIVPERERIRERAFDLSCDDQYWLAQAIAANVGYQLTPEASIQDAEDSVPARIAALEAAVQELNPGWSPAR